MKNQSPAKIRTTDLENGKVIKLPEVLYSEDYQNSYLYKQRHDIVKVAPQYIRKVSEEPLCPVMANKILPSDLQQTDRFYSPHHPPHDPMHVNQLFGYS
ncbi:hypothetical protein ACJRPK_02545 [Aquimarina sp. 2-A2]|uniref:hypothetical protein n=1 Tax=Aquimarina sp. 2-A2 TaxID=3382644 RepID=UPI00387EF33D